MALGNDVQGELQAKVLQLPPAAKPEPAGDLPEATLACAGCRYARGITLGRPVTRPASVVGGKEERLLMAQPGVGCTLYGQILTSPVIACEARKDRKVPRG